MDSRPAIFFNLLTQAVEKEENVLIEASKNS